MFGMVRGRRVIKRRRMKRRSGGRVKKISLERILVVRDYRLWLRICSGCFFGFSIVQFLPSIREIEEEEEEEM